MILQYNGVLLQVIELQQYKRSAIYTEDGTVLLYIRHVLGFTTEYGPGGAPRMPSITEASPSTIARWTPTGTEDIHYKNNPQGNDPFGDNEFPAMEHDLASPRQSEDFRGSPPSVDPSLWHSGPQTDAELSSRLLSHRKKLILWAWDRQTGNAIKWLESPRAGLIVDATTGPTPLACDIISASGEPNTVGVYFQIQTDLPPCPIGSDRFVLSHRWQMSHTYDDDYYLTRVTQGEVIFHAGVRELIQVNPDSLRNQFILPIPLGFRRRILGVDQSSDGLTIRYTVADTDPSVLFSPGDSGATQMQIVEQSAYTKPAIDITGKTEGLIPGMPWTTPENLGRGRDRILGFFRS